MRKTARQRITCLVVLLALQASAQTPPYRVPPVGAGITRDGPSGAPFSLRQEQSGWWLVSPDGEPFLSLGVCVVTQGVPRGSFDPNRAGNWGRLQKGGMLYLRGDSEGIRVMRQFQGLMAERYYQLVHEAIRKYDRRASGPGALLARRPYGVQLDPVDPLPVVPRGMEGGFHVEGMSERMHAGLGQALWIERFS